MIFDLDDETRLLQQTVREFALGEVAPVAEHLDRTKSFPYELVTKMGALGWMGIPFPEEYGGSGYGLPELVVVIEELGRAIAPGPFVPTVTAGAVLATAGTDELKNRFLAVHRTPAAAK